jgi:hypothetical protein
MCQITSSCFLPEKKQAGTTPAVVLPVQPVAARQTVAVLKEKQLKKPRRGFCRFLNKRQR